MSSYTHTTHTHARARTHTHTHTHVGDARKNTVSLASRTLRRAKGGRRKHCAMLPARCFLLPAAWKAAAEMLANIRAGIKQLKCHSSLSLRGTSSLDLVKHAWIYKGYPLQHQKK